MNLLSIDKDYRMYKFPYGKRMATMTPESFFDCIDLPAFSVDAFAPEARAKAIRDYCSYVLSTFNYNGLKPRGMLLRLDIEGAYFPTIELLNADGKQGVAPDNIRLGYVVTMTEQLDAVVTSLLTAKDSVEIHRHPSDVVAAIYVVTDGMFSKRSGTVTFSPRQAALNAVTVELPNLNYTGKCDIARPVKFSQSLYASRCRSLSAGDLNVTADGQFHFVPTKDFLRNLMVMNIVDHDESATFSFGLNGLTLSVHNEKDRVTDLYTAQLNGLIVPPYVHEIPADTAVVIESAVDGKETYEEWHAREAAFNTPGLLPVIQPARVDKFVDPNLITPWTVKTPTGEYATSFLKLGSGNLLDVFQFWGEQEHYRIDADAGIADLLIAITHRVEVGEPIVEYHKVTVPDMRFYLEEDARSPRHRKLTNQCQAIVGTRDYFGNPSSLVSDIGLAVRVTLTGSLNLDTGGWALNGQNIFAFAREGDPAHDYQFKILGWTPRMRLVRVEAPVELTSADESEARIPAHLLDIAYGAYLAGLVEGQEAMPRAVFASQPSKPLLDTISVLNFARGMATKHVWQPSPQKEDVEVSDPKRLLHRDVEVHARSITLTGDPVTLNSEEAEDGFVKDSERLVDTVMNTSFARPACINTVAGMLWFCDVVHSGIMRQFPEWNAMNFDSDRKSYIMLIDGAQHGFNDDADSVRRLDLLLPRVGDVSEAEWGLLVSTMTPDMSEVIRKAILADIRVVHDSAVAVNPAYFCAKAVEIVQKERYGHGTTKVE